MEVIPFNGLQVALVIRRKRGHKHAPGILEQHVDVVLLDGSPMAHDRRYGEDAARRASENPVWPPRHHSRPREPETGMLTLYLLAMLSAAQIAAYPANGPCTAEAALLKVTELPEAKAWNAHIQARNAGLKSGQCLLVSDEQAPDRYKGRSYWTDEFTELDTDPDIPPFRWETFLVRVRDRRIFVQDLDHGTLLTLEQWRKHNRPMKRIGQ